MTKLVAIEDMAVFAVVCSSIHEWAREYSSTLETRLKHHERCFRERSRAPHHLLDRERQVRRSGGLEPAPAIVDIAPTVLRHLGVAVDPKWKLDGKAVGRDLTTIELYMTCNSDKAPVPSSQII
jgi:hypothetical protein